MITIIFTFSASSKDINATRDFLVADHMIERSGLYETFYNFRSRHKTCHLKFQGHQTPKRFVTNRISIAQYTKTTNILVPELTLRKRCGWRVKQKCVVSIYTYTYTSTVNEVEELNDFEGRHSKNLMAET